MLTKIRRIATLLDEWERAFGPDGLAIDPIAERRVRRRLEELVELLWQTDELRVVRPEPIDEARNAVYYFDALHHDAVPNTLELLGDELARIGVELPIDARPLTFGTWIGGDRDGNPNVTPEVDARRDRAPARARDPGHARRRRRTPPRALLLGPDHRCHDRARGLARGRHRAPARSSTRATGA